MKELTIRMEGILTGVSTYKVRVKPKVVGGQHGWDIWFQRDGKWVKKTRGNSFLRADSLDEVIKKCLFCGEYCFGKTLLSITDV